MNIFTAKSSTLKMLILELEESRDSALKFKDDLATEFTSGNSVTHERTQREIDALDAVLGFLQSELGYRDAVGQRHTLVVSEAEAAGKSDLVCTCGETFEGDNQKEQFIKHVMFWMTRTSRRCPPL